VKTKVRLDVKPQDVAIIDSPGDEIGLVFAQLHFPFYLDLRGIDGASDLGQWLNEQHTQWTFGGVVDPDDVFNSGATHLVLGQSFDGLFFVPTSTATTALGEKPDREPL
jgi:hypothetical protein